MENSNEYAGKTFLSVPAEILFNPYFSRDEPFYYHPDRFYLPFAFYFACLRLIQL
jgi:hypothetical protein